eukprot:gnl/MRDRNA2_/MRDRNA2_57932_c0_seq1.p1 gnl/MRDRNA2_/MRDRNA2_57932_c0~~gnl/MRDRNA2_/MRDRNA2_57932_c0_seq1.p1  ORF type:complete len:400 (+),score=75.51 gnl/MRDRNA2_/MRDRNA2_57932_c0_seq1:92-1291(+)
MGLKACRLESSPCCQADNADRSDLLRPGPVAMSETSRFWHEQMVFSHQAQELFECAQRGNLHRAQELLERGTNPNVCDVRGLRPLQIAIASGHTDIAAAIVHSLADVNAYNRDLDGALPALHLAAVGHHFEAARTILSAQANTHLTERKSGDTVLHRAAALGDLDFCQLVLGFCSEGTRKFLLDRGNKAGLTALHVASQGGHLQVCKDLIATAADPTARDKRGWSPLLHAAADGHTEVLNLFLSPEARATYPQREEVALSDLCTALHLSSQNGHSIAVRYLLRMAADVHGTDKEGRSALHKACAASHAEVAQLLLCADADPSRRDAAGSSALSLALEAGLTNLAQMITRFGGRCDPVNDRSTYANRSQKRFVPPQSEFRTDELRALHGGFLQSRKSLHG